MAHQTGSMDDTVNPLLREIGEQPATFVAAAQGLRDQMAVLQSIAEKVRASRQPLVLTGMGSSLDACQAAASLLGRAGWPVLCVNTAELAHFRVPALRPGSCVIAISQSGRSAEVLRLAERLQAVPDVWLGASTNGVDNPLAGLADDVLDMGAGSEVGPATKTFTASLIALAALVDTLTTGSAAADVVPRLLEASEQAAAQAQRLLRDPEELASRVDERVGARPHLVLVGRGVARAGAEVGALVLKEASRTAAECLDAAEFRHGPLELAGPDLAVVVVSLEPTTLDLDRRLLADLLARGSAVIAIGLADPRSEAPRIVVDPVAPLLDVALASLPLQLLAWWRARNDETPGAFLVGSKVTTQE